jgi:hypothetical protein
VKLSLKPRSLHDVSCAEEVLADWAGTVIGHSEYVSVISKDSLAKKSMRLVAKHRQNVAPDSQGTKIPKRTVLHRIVSLENSEQKPVK